ncbi:MAG: hypothetical protein ACRC1T_14420 [Clostridium chrysemydis]|uniref:hypothetical protein n=1 Tax=Clostridium chrysemydis TaxID=2665504 RepID=UPI003F3DBBE5
MGHDFLEIKISLVDLLMESADEERIRALERKAIENDIFDTDNGKPIVRKNKESLGAYINRYSSEIMKNFSEEKYSILKSLYRDYNKSGDKSIVSPEITKKKSIKDYKKHIAAGATATAVGLAIFKMFKSRKK